MPLDEWFKRNSDLEFYGLKNVILIHLLCKRSLYTYVAVPWNLTYVKELVRKHLLHKRYEVLHYSFGLVSICEFQSKRFRQSREKPWPINRSLYHIWIARRRVQTQQPPQVLEPTCNARGYESKPNDPYFVQLCWHIAQSTNLYLTTKMKLNGPACPTPLFHSAKSNLVASP